MFAVAGITGRTGAVVAQSLLDAGHRVRGLVRRGDTAAYWSGRQGVELREVPTLADAASLTSALDGVRGAYLLLPTDMRSEAFLEEARRTEEEMAHAVERSAVPHVVHLSSIGAHQVAGTGPIRALHHAEQRMVATEKKLTLLRAALFLENWGPLVAIARAGTLPTFVAPNLPVPSVSAADIGRVAAQALLDGPPASSPEIIELSGTHEVSAAEVAAILAGLLGHEVVPQRVPLQTIEPTLRGFGISEDLSTLYRELYEGVMNGAVSWQGNGTRSLRGSVTPEQVLRNFTGGQS